MARTITSVVSLPPSQPYWLARWYFLMADGTMWSFSVRDGPVWTQAPAIPGARVVTQISAQAGNQQNNWLDTVYAATNDGLLWSAVVTTPFSWQQVASTPP
jgi:biotin synthase-related radical SAM superfamily protein